MPGHLSTSQITPHRDRYIHELLTFCRQRSISSTGEGMTAMSQMVIERLQRLGARTSVYTVGQSYPFILPRLGTARARSCSTITMMCSRPAVKMAGRMTPSSRRFEMGACMRGVWPITKPTCCSASRASKPTLGPRRTAAAGVFPDRG